MKLKENIQIASFDLDDTLLVGGVLSEYTKQALIKLHNCGCKIVINTGRGLRFVPEVFKESFVDYIIASNGSNIYDNQNKQRFKASYIDSKDVQTVYSLMKKQHAIKLMVDNKTYTSLDMYPFYIYMHFSGKAKYQATSKDLFRFLNHFTPRIDLQKYVNSNPKVLKMECTCSKKCNPHALAAEINQKCNVNAVVVRGNFIELASKEAGKGNALLYLANTLQIPTDAIAAFGDSGNDIDAFYVSKYAIAVDNAVDNIKNAATLIIDSATNDGVGKYINSIIEE